MKTSDRPPLYLGSDRNLRYTHPLAKSRQFLKVHQNVALSSVAWFLLPEWLILCVFHFKYKQLLHSDTLIKATDNILSGSPHLASQARFSHFCFDCCEFGVML